MQLIQSNQPFLRLDHAYICRHTSKYNKVRE